MLGHPVLRYLVGILLLVVGVVAAPVNWLGVPLRRWVVEAFVTPTAGMTPTLLPGDRFLCHKRLAPTRWSIVVFEQPMARGSKSVFRVVGLPGEMVEVREGQVHINDQPVPAPQGAGPYRGDLAAGLRLRNPGCEGNPVLLGADEYYLLGDNSAIAADSRVWNVAFDGHGLGVVPAGRIEGTVTWIYWPPSRWRRF
jgi:signal peptidase I